MLWAFVAIFGYFCSAVVALFDKYLLKGRISSPKVYAFYVGILGILVLIFAPLVGFVIPGILQIFLALLAGALFIYSLFWFLKALSLFEASRVVPIIGGLTPLFVFGLTHIFLKEVTLGFSEILAFILLITGSILITLEKRKTISFKILQISVLTVFLFSLHFILAKLVYLEQPFWSGFIWIRIGSFLTALFFLFSKEVKEELFIKRVSFKKETAGIFLLGQTFGAGSVILQSWAIALVPLGFLAFINALEGTKYIFLLIFIIFFSLRFPQIVKEEISKEIISQKIIAILLIGGGLVILAF